MGTVRMTTAQALIKFLDNQYVLFDGKEEKFVTGVAAIFGHGIVCGVGQALDENPGNLKVYHGRNEQGMAHMATAYAKQNNRRKIIACSSSIGPGAANMVTAAATATVNNIPLLLLPGDSFATRQPDPVLQQVEQSTNLGISTNDAFKAVTKYWDRVSRPEQLMTALISAMRTLTDPAETGAVCIALPQDVQGESYDYPDYFFEKKVHRITRPTPVQEEMEDIAKAIFQAKKPVMIVGGGVRYSEAGETVEEFCEKFRIPFVETQAGKSSCKSSHMYNMGGGGVTGNISANLMLKESDLIIAVGSRLSDFTTASKTIYGETMNKPLVTINMSRYHAYKSDAVKAVGDAKAGIIALSAMLSERNYKTSYVDEHIKAKQIWEREMEFLRNYKYGDEFEPLIDARPEKSIEEFANLTGSHLTQVEALSLCRKIMDDSAIAVGASGSLPGDMQRMWTTDTTDAYHMEYGYSCMGYEIAAALGAKLACPEREVYAFVGDGSYIMLHSEVLTAMQERKKINIVLFDNSGFGCINNLQMSNGIGSLATEFRYRESDGDQTYSGDMIVIDYAKSASGYGLKTYSVANLSELELALEDAKKQTVSTLIDIKVLPKTMTAGYDSWWHVGIAGTSENEAVIESWKDKEENLKRARKY